MYKGKSFAKGFYPLFRILRRTFSVFLLDLLHTLKGCTPSQHPPPPPPPFFFYMFLESTPPPSIHFNWHSTAPLKKHVKCLHIRTSTPTSNRYKHDWIALWHTRTTIIVSDLFWLEKVSLWLTKPNITSQTNVTVDQSYTELNTRWLSVKLG